MIEHFIGAILAIVYVAAVALFLIVCLFRAIVWLLFMFSPEPPKAPRHAAPPRDWTPPESKKEEL